MSRPSQDAAPTQVTFHAIAAGGEAVGRDETGRAIFAPYGAPGDIAQVVLHEEKRSFARGRIIDLEVASPKRTPPPCPYYIHDWRQDETACGGCQVQHLEYAAQLEAKRHIVCDALQRIGRVQDAEVAPCIPSPQPFGYRNKGDFVVGMQSGRAQVGLNARNSHDIIDIESCPIQQQPNNELLAAARACIAQGLAPPFDAASGRGVLRRLVMRTATNGEMLLIAMTTGAAWPQVEAFAQRMLEMVPWLVGVMRREPKSTAKPIAGRDWLEETVLGIRLRATGDAFFQINSALTPTLVETALGMAQIEHGQRALDLYCGVGLFSLAMARQGAQVLGIEAHSGAVRDAQFNALQNGLTAEFKAGDAAKLLSRAAGSWDVVLLDPPRAGAAECLEALLKIGPQRIVYVSCDPATLARDLGNLREQYRLVEAVPVDLFPQTAHVETVALLQRI